MLAWIALSSMTSLLPATARAQAVQAVAAPRASAKAQPAAPAQLGGQTAQKQWVRNALAQRRGIAQRRTGAARSASAARVVARAGGEALVIGSSGQTAARVIVQLLRAGFKVTAGAQGLGQAGVLGVARPCERLMPASRYRLVADVPC